MHQPVETNYRSSKELKYAIVELIAEKGRASSIECGLLRGIGKGPSEDFLWIVTDKKVSRACSLSYYNILSVVTFDGLTKTYTFFMADEDEQKMAKEIAEKAYEELKKLALPEKAMLLDVTKFEDVPTDFGRLGITRNAVLSSANKTGSHDWYSKGYGGNDYSYRRDPEPFSWKRKTRKPTKKALEALREKLDLIAKREYEFTARIIKAEEKKEKEEEVTKEDINGTRKFSHNDMFNGYDEDNFPFGCG